MINLGPDLRLLITDQLADVNNHDLVIDLRNESKIDHKNVISIFEIIENNAAAIKSEVLSWLDSYNFFEPNGYYASKALHDFKTKNLWQPNRLNERCNFSKLSFLDDIIKIFAVNFLVTNQNFSLISLDIGNETLDFEISKLLRDRKVIFRNLGENQKKITQDRNPNKKYLLITFLKSILWATIKLYEICVIKFFFQSNLSIKKNIIYFFSYFSENDVRKDLNSESSYWGKLPENLLKNHSSSCWIYIKAARGNIKTYCSKLNFLNIKNEYTHHMPIEIFISFKEFFLCYLRWLKMSYKGARILHDQNLLDYKYFCFIKSDLRHSLCGLELLENIFYDAAFKSLVGSINEPKNSFYLHENQSWEYFLRLHWNQKHENKLSGFAHSYIRFWDLRYFYSPNFNFKSPYVPDYLLCTSNGQLNEMIESGFPKDKLRLVESLRYNWIDRTDLQSISQTKILISGDYKFVNNKNLISMLFYDIEPYNKDFKFFFLPHPSSSIKKITRILPDEVTIIHRDEINIHNINLAIVSNLSAACIDYKILGIPTLYHYSKLSLNMSPFRLSNACNSFTNKTELKSYLNQISKKTFKNIDLPDDFLQINKKLILWSKEIFEFNKQRL